MRPAMIAIDQVTFGYSPESPIFESFTWSVEAGEAWCVLGPSGCGKTTLLYLLAGLRRPISGDVRVDGESLRRPRPRTGLVLQDYGLMPWATVWENIALGLRVRGFYGPDGRHAPRDEALVETQSRVDTWLDRMDLRSVSGNYPAQISGGQRQRTAISRTLALRPDLLLMDEPFASLDAPTREDLQELTLQLRAESGLTLILVTHTLEEAAFLGRKILLLGRPPTRRALVVDNPRAGTAGYRRSEAYASMCRELRERLGALV
ncbi:MAG TPA: ATP-binding cassette domain-containing protein [Anaerolineales bacterium]|nr:ATP-binding cassette domain-containing protein [Anaerolineales bacterium]